MKLKEIYKKAPTREKKAKTGQSKGRRGSISRGEPEADDKKN